MPSPSSWRWRVWTALSAGDPRAYGQALLAAGMAAMIKYEGQVVVLVILALVLFRAVRSGAARSSYLSVLPSGLIALTPLIAWKIVTAVHGYPGLYLHPNDVSHGLADALPRALYILDFSLHVTSFSNDFGWILLAAILALELSILNRFRSGGGVALVLAIQVAVYFGIYLVTPVNLGFQLANSFDRLALQVTPGIILWLGLSLSPPPDGETATNAPARVVLQRP